MELYQLILRGQFIFPQYVGKVAKEIIQKLLVSNPSQRLGSLKRGHREISSHAFFKTTDWTALVRKELKAPYVPTIKSPTDTSNFDEYEDEGGEDWTRFNDKSKNLFKGF